MWVEIFFHRDLQMSGPVTSSLNYYVHYFYFFFRALPSSTRLPINALLPLPLRTYVAIKPWTQKVAPTCHYILHLSLVIIVTIKCSHAHFTDELTKTKSFDFLGDVIPSRLLLNLRILNSSRSDALFFSLSLLMMNVQIVASIFVISRPLNT